MKIPLSRRAPAMATLVLAGLASALTALPSVRGGIRHADPAAVVPIQQVAPEFRDSVAEVIASPTFHQKGRAETFSCHPRIYLNLLGEPTLTLALWKDLADSPVKLRQVGPDRYLGTDEAGTTATGGFVLRSPRLHVLHGQFECLSPRGNARLEGRVVLLVRTEFLPAARSEAQIRHEVEAFVKIDSRGWRALAKTVRPLVETFLEDQVQEAGWFVSLMGKLVETYPNWACQVARQGPEIRPEVRQEFCKLVVQARRPNASPGRPTFAQNAPPAATTRTR